MIQLLLSWIAKNYKSLILVIASIVITLWFTKGCDNPHNQTTQVKIISDTTHILKDSVVVRYHDSTFFIAIPTTIIDTSIGTPLQPSNPCSSWLWNDIFTRPDSGWVKVRGTVMCNPAQITDLSLEFSPLKEHIVYVDSSHNSSSSVTFTTIQNTTEQNKAKKPLFVLTPYFEGDVYSSAGGISAALGVNIALPRLLNSNLIPYAGASEKISGSGFGQTVHVGIYTSFEF